MQKLKLSPETIAVLQNFAGINKSILVKPGSELTTISETKSIIGVAQIKEEFSKEFAIFDLPKFLASLSLFSEPELEFGDKQVTIREGARKLNYTFSDKRTVLSIEKESIDKLAKVAGGGEVKFSWADATYQAVSKARSVLKLPELVVEGDGESIKLKAEDTENSTGDTYEAVVGDTSDKFRAVFRSENIKFLPKDYEVQYSTRGIAKFAGEGVTYFVTTEAKK
jgi:hypothetical protein